MRAALPIKTKYQIIDMGTLNISTLLTKTLANQTRLKMKTRKKNKMIDTYDYIMQRTRSNPADNFRHADLFTMKDHVIVKQAVQTCLTDNEQAVINFYFWEDYSLDEVAEQMDMAKAEINLILEKSYKKIRVFCMGEPEFSRSTQKILSEII